MSLISTINRFDALNADFGLTIERLEKIADELVGQPSEVAQTSRQGDPSQSYSMVNALDGRLDHQQDLSIRLRIAVDRIEEGMTGPERNGTGVKASLSAKMPRTNF